MEQPQETTKSNKHIGVGVTILIAAVAFLIGFGVFALLNALSGKPTEPNKNDKDTPAQQSTLSYETYKDLVRRTNIIAFYRNTTDQAIIGGEPFFSFEDIISPSADMKSSFAYMYSNVELPAIDTWDRTTSEEAKAIHEALGHTDYDTTPGAYFILHDYDMTDIQTAYKKFFGEELDMSAKTIYLSNSVLDCTIYLTSTKSLYAGLCGGGMGMNESYTYINDVALDGDKAYVYFNFLRSDYAFGDWLSAPNLSDLYCYDNFSRERTANCSYYFGNGITNDNYQNLKNYRLVFEKDDDDNYVYKTAELAK